METAKARKGIRYKKKVPLAHYGYWLILFSAEKLARGAENDAASKDGEELDQVAGNAEDEIGERIATVRETELLYGPESLLALYGPLLVRICGRPDQFKVRPSSLESNLFGLTPGRTRRCVRWRRYRSASSSA